MLENILLFVASFVSFMIGAVVQRYRDRKEFPLVGAIWIDHSDPDGPHLFYESSVQIEDLEKERFVLLAVSKTDLIPRK